MFMNALIVGLVLMFTKFFDWWGNTMFQRPIFCVAILGALLGHPGEGIILAAQLELVFLGNVSLGGVMPSDFTLSCICHSAGQGPGHGRYPGPAPGCAGNTALFIHEDCSHFPCAQV